ncbi:MAG: E3 ubiquitin ligase family protein [Methylohalobius sp.]|nr:E3 ubiquitin ligase family protein [Methylohalobius sp.]
MEAIAALILAASPERFWGGIGTLVVFTAGLFYFGFKKLYLACLMEDTPTARIRSAPQGYVELEGLAVALGELLHAPLSGRACVWYQYRIDRRQTGWQGRKHWVSLEGGTSEAIFGLEDDTGQCVVDPEGAEIHATHERIWYGHEPYPGATPPGHSDFTGPYRYTERWVEPGDSLYALGWFQTLKDPGPGLEADARELLRRWKMDPKALRERFDLNRDGEVDSREWDIARKQAAREALQERWRQPAEEAVHVLRMPPQKAPFILAAVRQSDLVWRYRLWALGALCGFALGCLALAWALWLRF